MKKIIIIFLLLLSSAITYADTVDVYCPQDNQFMFTLEYGDELLLNDLKVQNVVKSGIGEITNNTRFICPLHQAPLNGWEYWAWQRGMDFPRMAYPALSVWTKNENGEFYWFPDDIDISNN